MSFLNFEKNSFKKYYHKLRNFANILKNNPEICIYSLSFIEKLNVLLLSKIYNLNNKNLNNSN